jgi:hypothetical protein
MVQFTQVQQYPEIVLAERAGHFPVPGAHLYTVLHEVETPLARVLLIGPFTSERHTSYRLWLQWARYLAVRGIEVVRFDYRGIGESTGVFAEMSFRSWGDARMAQPDKSAAPLVPGDLLQGFEECKDRSWLFALNYEWITSILGIPL